VAAMGRGRGKRGRNGEEAGNRRERQGGRGLLLVKSEVL